MHSSIFFKIFPPPKYLVMHHAGLHISDDGIRFIEFAYKGDKMTIAKYGKTDFPPGLVDGGDVKDPQLLAKLLKEFDDKYDIAYAKISVPEEKAYLFRTEVPEGDTSSVTQNIEFKLEQNVPLSAADAVFYFDILGNKVGSQKASVSVVARSYIETLISMLRGSGIAPVAFEVLPKAVARSVIPANSTEIHMIINVMNNKTGIYIASENAVSFSSTIAWGAKNGDPNQLIKEIIRVVNYWSSHEGENIKQIWLVGTGSVLLEETVRAGVVDLQIKVNMANIWQNFFHVEDYLPPIGKEESLDYSAAAGLAVFI